MNARVTAELSAEHRQAHLDAMSEPIEFHSCDNCLKEYPTEFMHTGVSSSGESTQCLCCTAIMSREELDAAAKAYIEEYDTNEVAG